MVGVEWARLPVPDVSWLLYLVARLGEGAEYGTAILDRAPPPILWYSAPATWMSQHLPGSDWQWFLATVVATAALAIGLAQRLIRRLRPPGDGSTTHLLAAAVVATLVLPWGVFGEREHVTLLLTLPYVLAAAVRERSGNLPGWLALVVGGLGGFGFAIKPHFALPWVLLVATAAWRRGGLRYREPELVTAAAVAGACVGLVLWRYTAYVALMRTMAPLYGDYATRPLWFVGLLGEGLGATFVLLSVVVALALWRDLPEDRRALASYVLAATVGFHLAAVLQQKGWRYHYVPGMGFAFVLLVALLTAAPRRLGGRVAAVYRMAAVGAVAVAVGWAALGTWTRWSGSAGATFDPDFEPLLRQVRDHGHGRPVAVLSVSLGSAFPLTAAAHASWALRDGQLWWLAAFYPVQVAAGPVVRPKPYDQRSALEQRLARELVTDVAKNGPGLLVVPIPLDRGSLYRRLDYLKYWADVPGWDSALARYADRGRVGAYRVLELRSSHPPAAWGPLVSEPSPRVTPPFSRASWRWSLAALALAAIGLTEARRRAGHRS